MSLQLKQLIPGSRYEFKDKMTYRAIILDINSVLTNYFGTTCTVEFDASTVMVRNFATTPEFHTNRIKELFSPLQIFTAPDSRIYGFVASIFTFDNLIIEEIPKNDNVGISSKPVRSHTCDCGAVSLGYDDKAVPGHSSWCSVHTKSSYKFTDIQ